MCTSLPQAVAVRLRIERGSTGVRLDERHASVVYDEHDWHTPDYADATDRYEIMVVSGVSKLTIVSEK